MKKIIATALLACIAFGSQAESFVTPHSDVGGKCPLANLISQTNSGDLVVCNASSQHWKKVATPVFLYSFKIFEKSIPENVTKTISGTGVYNNKSVLVDTQSLINKSQYSFVSGGSSISVGDNVFPFNFERGTDYVKSAVTHLTTEKLTTDIEKGMIIEGVNFSGVNTKGNEFKIDILERYKTGESVYDNGVEFPRIGSWKASRTQTLSDNQSIRIDSPVLIKDGQRYKKVYIVTIEKQ